MRTQRLQNDRLPIFDGKVLKFLKRHVEVNLNMKMRIFSPFFELHSWD